MKVLVNSRFRQRDVTGVERFATEVVGRLAEEDATDVEEILPSSPAAGLRGHAWEQIRLPGRMENDSVLFSPCNTGPVRVQKQLVVIHDAAVWDCPGAFSRSFGMLYRNLLPVLVKRGIRIATVSEFSRGRLAHHLKCPEESIEVLGNAVGGQFIPGEPKSDAGSDESHPTLLCVGSLDPRKNFHRLAEAWISLSRRRLLPDRARLEIIGAAKPTNFAATEQVDAPGIHWLGRVSDAELVEAYQRATAFIFPSLYEGFGLPPLEAMACGCPVLLSNQASLPEVGGPDFRESSEGAALYFDPMSNDEIGDAILSVFTFEQKQIAQWSENALARAATFSWDDVAEKTLKALSVVA